MTRKKEKGSPLWMPLYVADYLAATWDLSAEEHGAYLIILLQLWQSDGRLPLERLERTARVPTERWPHVWSSLSRFFEVEDGWVSQRRLTRELELAHDRRESAADRGRLGGRPKKAELSQPETSASPGNDESKKLSFSPEKAEGKLTTTTTTITKTDPGEEDHCTQAPVRRKAAARRAVGLAPDPARDEKVLQVLAHYRTYHPRAMPKPHSGMVEWRKVTDRLAEGRTVEDLCRAIDGYHADPWYCGQNDRGRPFLDLELMVRDERHVARGIELPLARQAQTSLDSRTRASLAETDQWLHKQQEAANE